ncbi:MAG: sulfite exporter TauE/SafE family protein [Gammaproteobacteria bacterium]|nr:sulfite exporter TauE/SafE family protein [Gammaproteobacteria bacterium]
MSLLLWPLAFVVGIILALFGAGGGMTTVPLLIYFGDIPVKEAIAMSLWVVAGVSLTAIIHQRAWKVLHMKLLITFGISGIVGSFAGASLGIMISETLQSMLFSLLLVIVSVWLLLKKAAPTPTNRNEKTFNYIFAAGVGVAIGILTGILGVGGGFLLVPALIWLGVSQMPITVAHSLVLIIINSVVAGSRYAEVIDINIGLTIGIVVAASLGAIVGGMLLEKIPQKHLQKGFAYALLLLGVLMAARSVL